MQRTPLHSLARMLIALLFLGSALTKLLSFETTAEMMAQMGIPFSTLALSGALVVEVGGGLLLLSGNYVRTAAVLLVAFLIPTTLIFHVPFVVGPEWQTQLVQTLKNLAVMGALLEVYLHAEAFRGTESPAETSSAVARS